METLADTLRQEEITARRAVVTAAEASTRRAAVGRTAAAVGIPAAVAGIIARSGNERKACELKAAEVSHVGTIISFAGYRMAYMVCGMSLAHASRLWYLFPNHPA